MYVATVDCATLSTSLRSSPWMRGAPQSKFSILICRTVKPTGLVADAILDVTRRGDLVLDLFLGSGTTLMAAERTGRRFRGLDIDPGYVDVAIERWSARTGLEPRLEGSGLIAAGSGVVVSGESGRGARVAVGRPPGLPLRPLRARRAGPLRTARYLRGPSGR
jgi:hypothetical protein